MDPGAVELLEALVARTPWTAWSNGYLSWRRWSSADPTRRASSAGLRWSRSTKVCRAKVKQDVGLLHLEEGDLAKAHAAFRRALQTMALNDAVLSSARHILDATEDQDRHDVMLALRAVAVLWQRTPKFGIPPPSVCSSCVGTTTPTPSSQLRPTGLCSMGSATREPSKG